MNYYDRTGRPINREQWTALFALPFDDIRRVALTERDGVAVSTVWLGLDHQYGDGPPLIFETMILDGPNAGDLWRYATEEDALKGHERACAIAFGEESLNQERNAHETPTQTPTVGNGQSVHVEPGVDHNQDQDR